MSLEKLQTTLNQYLEVEKYQNDLLYNGLQVEAHDDIKKVAFAVSPTQEIIEKAIREHCDTLITHHGLYWKKQQSIATGILGRRLSKLIKSSINLLSYHLPLDCHHDVGNNAQLGKILNLTEVRPIETIQPQGLLYCGVYKFSKRELIECIKDRHPHSTQVYDFNLKEDSLSVSWCSGAGGDFLESFQSDVFITGEISERHYTMAKELGITLIQAGHWASEVWGPKALALWVEKQLKLEVTFIDEINPI